jgi:hypothetical protein
MNGNGVWDVRESPSEAWQRLGLLGAGEPLTQAKYVECVTAAAERLQRDRFFSAETAREYTIKAAATPLHPETSTP